MKKRMIMLMLAAVLSLSACGGQGGESSAPEESSQETSAPASQEASTQAEPTKEEPAPAAALHTAVQSELEEQTAIDRQLMAEAELGYSFEEPFVIVNPDGNAPLSALVIFDTEAETEVSVKVKGHDAKDDIMTTFPAEKRHILPILGLYSGQETEVELTLADGTAKTLSVATEPVNEMYTKAEIVELDETLYDFSQLTFVFSPATGVQAYDSAGDLRFHSDIPAMPLRKLSNGNYAVCVPNDAEGGAGITFKGVMEMDLCGRIYNRYDVPGGVHHEVRELSNGNLLVASSRSDKSTISDFVIEIERETGNIVWELDLLELLDPTDGASMCRSTQTDWFHNNNFWYDEATDSLLLSGRMVDAVVCVEKSTKTLKWILGSNEGWTKTDSSLFFTPVEDGSEFEWQFAQHDSSILPDEDGNPATMDILLFDNGMTRAKPQNADKAVTGKDVYSRAVVYHINTEDMTISQKWQYGKERGESWYSSYISGATYDEATDVFWICAGGIMYDPAADSYDVANAGAGGNVERYALIDAVKDDELIYELKIKRHTFRCLRTELYDGQNHSVDMSVPGKWFVIS